MGLSRLNDGMLPGIPLSWLDGVGSALPSPPAVDTAILGEAAVGVVGVALGVGLAAPVGVVFALAKPLAVYNMIDLLRTSYLQV